MGDLSLDVFAEGWNLLKARFDENRPSQVRDLYYEQLSSELDDESFERGVRKACYADEFFPSPKRIVDLARGGDPARRKAHDDWLVIDDEILSPGRAKSGWTDRLSPAGKKALRIVGGVEAIKECSSDRLNFLRKDFVSAHRDMAPPEDPGDAPKIEPGGGRRIESGRSSEPMRLDVEPTQIGGGGDDG